MFSPRQLFLIALLLATTGGLAWWLGKNSATSAPVSAVTVVTPPVTIESSPPKPRVNPREDAAHLTSRLMQRDRLARTEDFLRILRTKDLPTLERLSRSLLRQDQLGYDLSIERQLLLFRLGQLAGPETMRQKFTTDADEGIHVHRIVLEGWATSEPTKALDWWRTLPNGRMRESLLTPLMQGLLCSDPRSWKLLADSLLPAELETTAIPLMKSVLDAQGPAVAFHWFETIHENVSHVKRTQMAVLLHQAILSSENLDLLLLWHDSQQHASGSAINISDARLREAVTKIGALGGASVLEALGNSAAGSLREKEVHRLARGWARAKPADAGKWVEKNSAHPRCSAVAFQLAMLGVSEHPDDSRRWLEFMDTEQRNLAEEIIAKYQAARDNRTPPPELPQSDE